MARKYKKSYDQKIKELQEQVDFLKKQAAPKMGRPTLFTDEQIKHLKTLCEIPWITEEEVAQKLEVTTSALEKFIRRKYDLTFSAFKNKNSLNYKLFLWGKNLECLKENIPSIIIFHDKNYLGMTDKQETMITGDSNNPFQLIINAPKQD